MNHIQGTPQDLFEAKGPKEQAKVPVTCLGMTFDNDEARRAHFTEELRKKLQDPEFRKIEGFPIYNAHSYHTKVPHKAIMRYMPTKKKRIPRIESLTIENYRALRKVTFDKLTPMTVLLGPNGSGKSTVFDVFNFLSECFQYGLRHAWDRRGRGKELKSRGADGPVVFELKYREQPKMPIITYHLAIDEGAKGPEVVEEWLQWKRGRRGRPFRFLEFTRGVGKAVSGEEPDENGSRSESNLRSADLIAVNTLG